MSDSASVAGDPWSAVAGAALAGFVALLYSAIKGLFSRNVSASDKAQEEMRADVKNILVELRSMHDEQARQRSEIASINKDIANLESSCKANHERIDALVSIPPRRGRKS